MDDRAVLANGINQNKRRADQPTRRSLLSGAAGLAPWLIFGRPVRGQSAPAVDVLGELPDPTTLPTGSPIPESAKSVVARVCNTMAIAGTQLHEGLVRDMIEASVRLACGRDAAADAWRLLLRTDDTVGIKFDQTGAEVLHTTDVFAEQLIVSLERAGFKREQIVLIDVSRELESKLGTQRRQFGWREQETAFGSAKERLAAVLEQVTAVVNVPTLRTDNITGLAGCLHNVSLPFVRRQSPYYRNGCVPYISDLLALPQIRPKLRIHVVNALRAVFDRGPKVTMENMWPCSCLIASRDPVAADHVSIDTLNARRAELKLPLLGGPAGSLPHVRHAAQHNLGTDDQDYIRIVEPR